jgi:hypothetical protein
MEYRASIANFLVFHSDEEDEPDEVVPVPGGVIKGRRAGMKY